MNNFFIQDDKKRYWQKILSNSIEIDGKRMGPAPVEKKNVQTLI